MFALIHSLVLQDIPQPRLLQSGTQLLQKDLMSMVSYDSGKKKTVDFCDPVIATQLDVKVVAEEIVKQMAGLTYLLFLVWYY